MYTSDQELKELAVYARSRGSHATMRCSTSLVYPSDLELEKMAILTTNRDSHTTVSLVSPLQKLCVGCTQLIEV